MRNVTTRTLLALALILGSGSSMANFHLMKVVEVFPGTAAAPNAQYVVIQMYSGGQNQVGGHQITVFDSAGTAVGGGTFTFAAAVGSGANQAKILIATTEAQTFFNVTANLIMTPVLPAGGGKVCFDSSPIDCVAWGNYSGSATGVGTPFNAPTGLVSGRAAIRRLDIAGSPTVLENADDTDVSANDFVLGTPAPRNNANVAGTIPPSTCMNGVIEGLEACDDGNNNDNDACSNTCTVVVQAVGIFASGFEDSP